MAQRTGLSSLRKAAVTMCRLVTAFSPLIKKLFPDDTALHTALDAMGIACSVLIVELDKVIVLGD
ncbi:hypothetical protein LCGC14_2226280 [marine sediment metagenome]|uniref:Uncharacterized protein n=1 Tax=marine sediment metagenome TaxID=412755 RepID=A0A0F9D9N6_9ZZZZ